MATLFKNLYTQELLQQIADTFAQVVPDFDTTLFLKQIFDADWEQKELKQRMRHISTVLRQHLATDYPTSVQQLLAFIRALQQADLKEYSIVYMFLPDYIEQYGLDDFDTSVAAFEEITAFTSCEFAVRPFIVKYHIPMLHKMQHWALHPNEHVRRLASEGCRPRLPWAMALPMLKEDPSSILPILEQLKDDESLYVRRSVANNVNDISKDHPDLVRNLAQQWIGQSNEVDWVVKHASRSLLKAGDATVMALFGFGSVKEINIENLQIKTPMVQMGEHLEFSFDLRHQATHAAKIRLEYGMYFLKKNGTHSKKVFKISEKEYPPNSTAVITRKQSFRPITTRVYYVGKHEVSIIVNGVEMVKAEFELEM